MHLSCCQIALVIFPHLLPTAKTLHLKAISFDSCVLILGGGEWSAFFFCSKMLRPWNDRMSMYPWLFYWRCTDIILSCVAFSMMEYFYYRHVKNGVSDDVQALLKPSHLWNNFSIAHVKFKYKLFSADEGATSLHESIFSQLFSVACIFFYLVGQIFFLLYALFRVRWISTYMSSNLLRIFVFVILCLCFLCGY
jgi:hypothetical protein